VDEPRNEKKTLDDFWFWFQTNASSIAERVVTQDLLDELDRRVKGLNANLSWEIGPVRTAEWAFTISPGMDETLIEIANRAVEGAPSVVGWQFHSSRQPKDWDRRFELRSSSKVISVDASGWKYVILRHADGGMEILVCSGPMPNISGDERSEIIQVVLESELGEGVLLDRKLTYALVEEVEKELRSRLKPLPRIREAFGVA
jgi:hypothetical protein